MKDKRQLDFVGKRRLAISLSFFLLFSAVLSLSFGGLNLGIDFTGGTAVELAYDDAVALEEVRASLKNSEYEGALVQTIGSSNSILLRLPPLENMTSVALNERVHELLPGSEIRLVDFVGPQVSQELAEDGLLALIYALGGILLYVMIRLTI